MARTAVAEANLEQGLIGALSPDLASLEHVAGTGESRVLDGPVVIYNLSDATLFAGGRPVQPLQERVDVWSGATTNFASADGSPVSAIVASLATMHRLRCPVRMPVGNTRGRVVIGSIKGTIEIKRPSGIFETRDPVTADLGRPVATMRVGC